MPARSIATGTISFGLVSIPVKLYSSGESASSVSFNMLDPRDKSRVKQQWVNAQTGEVVNRSELIKGYEFSKGQYVTFSDEELKELSEKAQPAIAISEFVPLDEVEPVFFDKAYYLGPEKGGERAYRLLGEAMRTTGRAALAKYAARGKQYLVMLRPYRNGLLMQQLLYADEVKDFAEVPLGDELEINAKELDLATQLIDQITTDRFEPQKYEDEVRRRILHAIEQKVQGQEVTFEEEAPKAQIIDLMEALKASLAKSADPPREAAPAAAPDDEAETSRGRGGRSKKAASA